MTARCSAHTRGLTPLVRNGGLAPLVRNGGVVANTANRVTNYAIELRTAYGTFPGPGYYSLCATNTGTSNTLATVQIRTDYEF